MHRLLLKLKKNKIILIPIIPPSHPRKYATEHVALVNPLMGGGPYYHNASPDTGLTRIPVGSATGIHRCGRCRSSFPSIRCPTTATARVPNPSSSRRCPNRHRPRCCSAPGSWRPAASRCCTAPSYWRCPSSVPDTYRLKANATSVKQVLKQRRTQGSLKLQISAPRC